MFWKLLVGDTIFAAVLVEMVARIIISIDMTTHSGLSILPIRLMGSEIVSPTRLMDADVRITPRPANRNIVKGRPMICPITWLRCDFAKRLKSGMLSDKVAQKPTIAVNAAMK